MDFKHEQIGVCMDNSSIDWRCQRVLLMLKPLDPFILRHIVVLVVKLQIQGSKSQWCIHIQYIYIMVHIYLIVNSSFSLGKSSYSSRIPWNVSLGVPICYKPRKSKNFFELQAHLILSSPKSNSKSHQLMIKSSHPLWSHQISQPIPHDFPPQCQVFHTPSAVPAGGGFWDIHRAGPAPGPTASQGWALKNDAGTSDLKNGW